MKKISLGFHHLLVLTAALGLLPARLAATQTFTNLYCFTALDPDAGTNVDGMNPNTMILSGNTLYGTANQGGSLDAGTVFAVNTDGSDFTNLYNFNFGDGGFFPYAGLVLSSNTLYGTACGGGSSGGGTVFKINTDGTGFTNLYSFSGADGAGPEGQLILSGNTLYGTANQGGSGASGIVFAIHTDGTGFTNLHSFTLTDDVHGTNGDGAEPVEGLVLSGNTLYGTTPVGGVHAGGTLFAVNTDGSDFRTLHSFSDYPTDGSDPNDALILSGNTLYGTATGGGTNDYGTIFAINTDGTGFTNIYSFTGGSGGDSPNQLILLGNTLYGTTFYGGSSGNGTVFAVNTNGECYTTLYSFTGGSDGSNPSGGLIFANNTLYGTTSYGGSSGNGTVFSLSSAPTGPPTLTLALSGTHAILTWSATGFTLQQNSNLAAPGGWTTSACPINFSNGTNSITITPSAGNLFFRLKQ